ncbi:hypothetical protein OROHE_017249 [Orobanche hederae]
MMSPNQICDNRAPSRPATFRTPDANNANSLANHPHFW